MVLDVYQKKVISYVPFFIIILFSEYAYFRNLAWCEKLACHKLGLHKYDSFFKQIFENSCNPLNENKTN